MGGGGGRKEGRKSERGVPPPPPPPPPPPLPCSPVRSVAVKSSAEGGQRPKDPIHRGLVSPKEECAWDGQSKTVACATEPRRKRSTTGRWRLSHTVMGHDGRLAAPDVTGGGPKCITNGLCPLWSCSGDAPEVKVEEEGRRDSIAAIDRRCRRSSPTVDQPTVPFSSVV